MFTEKKAAKQILEDLKTSFSERHCWQIVEARNFPHLDLNYYEQIKQELINLDFWHLEDLENLTLKETWTNPRSFVRVCLSLDGTIQAGFYQIKPKLWVRALMRLTGTKLTKAVDFETEFEDGIFVTTSNAQMAAVWDSPPKIFARYFPAETPVEDLLKSHRLRISDYAETKEVQPLKINSLAEALESQHRMEKIKADFRKTIGWIKKSEWDKLAGNPNQSTERIYDEFEEYRNESS